MSVPQAARFLLVAAFRWLLRQKPIKRSPWKATYYPAKAICWPLAHEAPDQTTIGDPRRRRRPNGAVDRFPGHQVTARAGKNPCARQLKNRRAFRGGRGLATTLTHGRQPTVTQLRRAPNRLPPARCSAIAIIGSKAVFGAWQNVCPLRPAAKQLELGHKMKARSAPVSLPTGRSLTGITPKAIAANSGFSEMARPGWPPARALRAPWHL
jgi:hypothetical protein